VCRGPLARVSWSAFPRVDRVNVFGWQSVFRGQPVLIFQKRVARPAAPNTVLYYCCDRHSARLYCRTIPCDLYTYMTYPGSFYKWLAVSSDAFPTTKTVPAIMCVRITYIYNICRTFNWNLCLINNTLGPAPNDNNKARRALQQKYIVKPETPAGGASWLWLKTVQHPDRAIRYHRWQSSDCLYNIYTYIKWTCAGGPIIWVTRRIKRQCDVRVMCVRVKNGAQNTYAQCIIIILYYINVRTRVRGSHDYRHHYIDTVDVYMMYSI